MIERIDLERDAALLDELQAPAERLLQQHQEKVTPWVPDNLVPYDIGKTYSADQPWSPDDYPLSEGVRSAIIVNTLTEDNLPYYTNEILGHAGGMDSAHPMRAWTGQWTAEEWRHGDVMGKWIAVSRAVDPALLQEDRMVQMFKGEVPHAESAMELLAYTSFQELATGVAHRNVAQRLDNERNGALVMGTLAGDEGHHYRFYSTLAQEAFSIDPSTMMLAAARQLLGFKMPGTGIPDFAVHEKRIAEEGIYDIRQFYGKVAMPTLKKWRIDDIREEALSPEAQKARQAIHRRMGVLARLATREGQAAIA